MPEYSATVTVSDTDGHEMSFVFEARTDEAALTRLPALDGDIVIELWRAERLVAIVRPDGTTRGPKEFDRHVFALISGA